MEKKANNRLLFGDAAPVNLQASKRFVMNIMTGTADHRSLQASVPGSECGHQSDQENRNYKFIIYMDDLSFEEFETEYKYLKAVIEGADWRKAGECSDL